MTNEYLSDSLPEENDVVSSDAQSDGSQVGEALTLDEINSHLGKNFTTKEAALKSLKDTQSFVGMRVAPKNEDTSELKMEVSKMQEDLFYAQNKDYEPYKGIISELKKANPDKTLSELVALDSFKTVYDDAKSYAEVKSAKSILSTNSRIGVVGDKLSQAQTAIDKGD